ncbi:hypothetical protein GCM10022240_00380 [Microbacterium kribbense]|uniref:Phosphatidic acid phosphatase type 2/haloperoxidase domain-containing protein n=1 Tax=Microbacterium kribbense TaxID=433645 RepID=A0ABP7G023_9MICO
MRLAWSVAFAMALVLLYLLAVRTVPGQTRDAESMSMFAWMGTGARSALGAVRYVLPTVTILLTVAVAGWALMLRRWREVGYCALLTLLVLGVTGPLRDLVFSRPYLGEFGYTQNSYPSRHVVLVFAFALVAVRLCPAGTARRLAAWAAVALTLLVAVASVASYAHRLSDVVGAVLLVGVVAPWLARAGEGGVRAHRLRLGAAVLWAAVIPVAWLSALLISGPGLTALLCLGVLAPAVVATDVVAHGPRPRRGRGQTKPPC